MILEGRVWILDDDDINTDVIYPGKYTYEPLSPEEMAKVALEDYDSTFASEVKEGDIIIAGRNFGCGSSREQAVTALKYAGVRAIIAESFARIYYRNAINQALLVIDSKEVYLAEMKKGEGLVRKYIPVKGTIKFTDEDLTDKAILQERLCIYRDWVHQATDKKHICKYKENKKTILIVPPGTIIQRFKL